MGSGSLAAMSIFKTSWNDDMNEDEAVDLVKRAILSGIFNDLGSGSNCDTCVIQKDRTVTMDHSAVKPNEIKPLRDMITRSDKLNMNTGTTAVLKSEFVPTKKRVGMVTFVDVTVTEMET